MTHFAGVVLVEPSRLNGLGQDAAFDAVFDLVSRYQETDEWGEDGTRYDWYQVGGRFTGLFDQYDPIADEANYATCKFCEGTGTTTQAVADQYPAYLEHVGKPCIQCNVGHGGEQKLFPGRSLNFQFEPHAGDVVPARNIDIERMRGIPSVIVTPDGEWHERARYGMFAAELPDEEGNEPKSKDEWTPEFCRLLDEHRDKIAVLVDFHV